MEAQEPFWMEKLQIRVGDGLQEATESDTLGLKWMTPVPLCHLSRR